MKRKKNYLSSLKIFRKMYELDDNVLKQTFLDLYNNWMLNAIPFDVLYIVSMQVI